MIDKKQIANAIEDALKELKKDKHLFLVDANERTLTHRLAIYLEEKIKKLESGWDVDCEYNRDVTSTKKPYTKKLKLCAPPDYNDGPPYEDENATTVFPDIIVHKRGKSGYKDGNLLVIEVKKSTSRVSDEYDKKCKLPAYLKELHYAYAYYILLETGNKCDWKLELIDHKNST